MRLLQYSLSPLVVLGSFAIAEAASWGFQDASASVQGKTSGVGGSFKEKLSPERPLETPVSFESSDTLKVLLTTTEDGRPKRPHQAFLTIVDSSTGLDTSYPFSVKDTGKGKVELTHKDLPAQFLFSSQPLKAQLVIASFGSSAPLNTHLFDLEIKLDPSLPVAAPLKPLRYGKQPEIHHIFRPDAKSPPKVVSLFFTAAVVGTLPLLLGVWAYLGANLNHLGYAAKGAPLAHALFFGSIIGLEGIFFLYYTRWNLFQTLPAAAAVGSVAYLSGSRALTEVQERRLAGLR